eukprot:1160134-Pelagomonas_calceolata.AAC.7
MLPGSANGPTPAENKVSPGQQQWWEMKAANFDSVLLFKQGKFYEASGVANYLLRCSWVFSDFWNHSM